MGRGRKVIEFDPAKRGCDICIGHGVIRAGSDAIGRWGWWLPGGVFTLSRIEAEAAARAIDKIHQGAA